MPAASGSCEFARGCVDGGFREADYGGMVVEQPRRLENHRRMGDRDGFSFCAMPFLAP